ncbi:gephyrin-like molybdotransferase Glp [Alkalihalobacterium alkalinitrilicum]|uniref:molybdopterin molybdotransferase MoeA n=1 Tax=Alkalihalobacterium alkalinitrilicum TaxID=427920 RepID=UPI000994BCF7|nr:gephyrin-like molybdotransferase Glp [Alkalihalobacterium alkalinitrilicum]
MLFYDVKTVEETKEIIKNMVQPIKEVVTLSLQDAFGYILAEDIVSKENVPAFARSTVDGYAVYAKDTYGSSESMPSFLTVTYEIKMGEEVKMRLGGGEAMSIPTGGMIPPGCDSIIMIEHCEDMDGLLNTYKQVAPGENIISVGEDVKEGEILLKKGTKLRSQELGILGAIGITFVSVYRKVKVGYLSSGDEIMPYDTENLQIGQVRDINQLTIATLTKEWGAEIINGGIVADDYESFYTKAKEMYNEVDLLVMSGGSSVGAKDFTTEVIQALGEPGILVNGVSIKPGKPTIFGMAYHKPVLGLPGHPASAVIIYTLFGEQIIIQLNGSKEKERPKTVEAHISQNIPSSPGRSDYIRVRLEKKENQWWAYPVLGKSGLISTLVQSDGMVEIPSKKEGISKGEVVSVYLFR